MRDLDEESRKNLIEVIQISGLILMTCSLLLFIYYFISGVVSYWSLSIVVSLCAIMVKKIGKYLSLKQLYLISLLLIVISVIIY